MPKKGQSDVVCVVTNLLRGVAVLPVIGGPGSQASKDFEIILVFNDGGSDAFVAQSIIAQPAGIGDHHHSTFARFGDGH